MSRSGRVTQSEVREVFYLVSECLELWADPQAWQTHLLERGLGLVRAQVGEFFEGLIRGPGQPPEFLRSLDLGWPDDGTRDYYSRFRTEFALDEIPIFLPLVDLLESSGGRVTALRRQILEDRAWYETSFYQDLRRPADNDDFIASLRRSGPGAWIQLSFHRPIGDKAIGERERRVIELLHDEIQTQFGARLATHDHLNVSNLPPRVRQTLDRLLEGDSEKEIALGLGLSRETVHEYVKRLHRHFEVSSRGELLAYFIQRRPRLARPGTP